LLSAIEGIIPALEPAHALAQVAEIAPKCRRTTLMVVNMCGRGDKDIFTVAEGPQDLGRGARRGGARAGLHDKQPYVVIIGGGQGGIALGARLRQLGVPTIIVEKNDRPGDSWRKRYKSLCLHDPVWYDHLPYMPFPETGRCSRRRTRSATGSRCTPRSWSSTTGLDHLQEGAATTRPSRNGRSTVDRDGEEVTLRPKQLVLATGMSGKANMPKFPGMDASRASSTIPRKHPGPTPTRARRSW
jgi:putative flavoprotein involved in K+ transport